MKDQTGTFLRNVTSLTSANFVVRLLGAYVSLLVINHLGEEPYGAYATAMAFATVFLIFAETGVSTRFLFDRSGDKSKVDEHFGAALILQVLPYLAAFVVTMVFAALSYGDSKPIVVTLIAIVATSAILRMFAEVCERVINAYQEMHLTALLRSARFAIVAVGGLFVVFGDRGPVAWALVTLVAMVFSAVASLMVAFRFSRPKFVRASLWPTLKKSYIFGIGAVCFAVYDKVDHVMLSKLTPEAMALATVGIYAAAYTLISFMYTIPGSFVASMEPLAYSARGDKKRLAYLGNVSVRAVGVVGIPFAIGTMLLAPNIQRLMLPSFAGAEKALFVLAVFALFRFVNFPAGIFMAAAGMQKRRVAVQGSATLLNIAVNFLVIPRWGLVGAACVTAATECYIAILYTAFLRRRLPGYRGPLGLGKVVAGAFVMASCIAAALHWWPAMAESRWVWLSMVPPAAGIYFTMLAALKFLRGDERDAIGRIVSKIAFWRGKRAAALGRLVSKLAFWRGRDADGE